MTFIFVGTPTAPIVTVIPGSDDIPVFGGLLALPSELRKIDLKKQKKAYHYLIGFFLV